MYDNPRQARHRSAHGPPTRENHVRRDAVENGWQLSALSHSCYSQRRQFQGGVRFPTGGDSPRPANGG